ncbi:MAG: pilus assembly protein TadG-related protein, partial [Acidobacteria bacterium]|nr:pilus assembly protein TadG-related protein [Acidobacteriota bacterium]
MKLSSGNRQQRRGERGSVIVVSAFGMLTFLVATGLCVDISHFYLVKTELQNAADAAALAGASALNQDATGITKAVSRATAAMNNYEFNKSGVTMTGENVRFAVNLSDFDNGGSGMSATSAMASPTNIRFVKVETPDVPVNVFFASVIQDFGNKRNMKAAAVAGRSVYINNYCDWLPFTVILDDADTLLKPGDTYTFRAGPGGMVTPGDYQILAAEGAGGQDVEVGAGEGVHICKKPGDEYPIDTKP